MPSLCWALTKPSATVARWFYTQRQEVRGLRLGDFDSARSSHLPFKMHKVGHVRSSLPILKHFGSIATPYENRQRGKKSYVPSAFKEK